MALALLSAGFQSLTSPTSHNQIGPFWCCFPSGWVCVHSRPLWVSPTNSPVRLGVSSAAASTPTGVFNQWFEALFPRARALGLVGLCHSLVVPPSLSVHECGTAESASHHLATSPLHPGCPSLPLLLVCMNVSSLSPWLSGFHTVGFSVSSGCFLFLSLLLSYFWLWEEAEC